MNPAILSLLVVLALPSTARGDALPTHAGTNVHARDGPDPRIGRGSSRPHLTWKALHNAMRNCEIVHNSFGVPVECMVTDFQGYPTVVVTFRSIRSMDAHSVTERSNAATEERLRSGHAVGGVSIL